MLVTNNIYSSYALYQADKKQLKDLAKEKLTVMKEKYFSVNQPSLSDFPDIIQLKVAFEKIGSIFNPILENSVCCKQKNVVEEAILQQDVILKAKEEQNNNCVSTVNEGKETIENDALQTNAKGQGSAKKGAIKKLGFISQFANFEKLPFQVIAKTGKLSFLFLKSIFSIISQRELQNSMQTSFEIFQNFYEFNYFIETLPIAIRIALKAVFLPFNITVKTIIGIIKKVYKDFL